MSRLAQINNVAIMLNAMDRLNNRDVNVPGFGVFYGFSGLGKSMAASFAAVNYNAVYVEIKSSWTKKALLEAICKELNIVPANVCYKMVDQIAQEMVVRDLTLIIDEFDYLVEKKAVSIVKDLHDASGNGSILLIGEENLPQKLTKWEHFSNRILDFFPAQPADFEDAKILRGFYSTDVNIEDDLLLRILNETNGCIRRIVVNIKNITEKANVLGKKTISAKEWQHETLSVGRPPKRRVAR